MLPDFIVCYVYRLHSLDSNREYRPHVHTRHSCLSSFLSRTTKLYEPELNRRGRFCQSLVVVVAFVHLLAGHEWTCRTKATRLPALMREINGVLSSADRSESFRSTESDKSRASGCNFYPLFTGRPDKRKLFSFIETTEEEYSNLVM